jgi:hypothetical protein
VRESSRGLVKNINDQFKVLEKLKESKKKKKRKKKKKNRIKKERDYLDINNCYLTQYTDNFLRKTTSNLIIINCYLTYT